MNTKSYIAIIGEFSSHRLDNIIQEVLHNNEAEVNVFDFPVVDGKDTVERVNDHLLVHKYTCPSKDLRDAVARTQEYTRDIIHLGANKYYLCKPKNKHYFALYESIQSALKLYRVDVQSV